MPKLISSYWRYWLVVTVPFIAIMMSLAWADHLAQQIFAADQSAISASHYGLFKIGIDLLALSVFAIYSRFVMSAWMQKGLHDWSFRTITSKQNMAFFMMAVLLALAAIGFFIVVITPLLHLVAILDLEIRGMRLLIFSIALPLGLWFGHYLVRILLVLPASISGENMNMREALKMSEDYGMLVFKIEIAILLLFALIYWMSSMIGEQFGFFQSVLLAVCLALSLTSASLCLLHLEKSITFRN